MRDRPGGPDQPDEQPDEPDASKGNDQPNQPDRPNEGDQQRESEQSGEADQPRKWYEFVLDDETEDEFDNAIAYQEKAQLLAEGYDPDMLDEIYGSDAELGFADDSTAADGFGHYDETAPDAAPETDHWTPATKRLEHQDDIVNGRVDVIGYGIVDERARSFLTHERRLADRVADDGAAVVARAEDHASHVKQPDADVDGLPVEFKSLREGATSRTVLSKLSDAASQAEHAIVDSRGTGLEREEAERGIRRFKGTPEGSRLETIRIIGDDYDTRHPHEEEQ